MTSNLGAQEVKKAGSLGFAPANEEADFSKVQRVDDIHCKTNCLSLSY